MPYYSPTTATILRRKSPPTCTLSLAHVSAAPKFHSQPATKSSVKVKNAELNLSTMQVELQVDFSSVITVPVQVHVDSAHGSSSAHAPSLRRSMSKKRIHLKRSEINVIPFPSASSSSSQDHFSSHNFSSSSTLSTPHVLLRSSSPDVHLHSSSSAGGAARRMRKGTVNTSVSISTSVRSTVRTSPTKNNSTRLSTTSQARTVSQLPPRPSSPTPTHLTQTQLQDAIRQLKKEDPAFQPPPYSSPPPPYSPSLEPSNPKSANPLSTPSSSSPPSLLASQSSRPRQS
ncbi:hypothetical protein CPB84DRAFT_188943 [Gymnopilus junonius]|uniref:Uncharacterized protein n=1 Tax=Gymnopilus junonius TaxID=109634 RepID=A0A9P5NDC2_GYMJU|nr:hypothetical protein CPB84DRAFT_188943 [Gymnopilus junonius]